MIPIYRAPADANGRIVLRAHAGDWERLVAELDSGNERYRQFAEPIRAAIAGHYIDAFITIEVAPGAWKAIQRIAGISG